MEYSDKEGWDEWLANQSDSYGKAIFGYAERWANLMEEQIGKGNSLEDCAENLSHIANVEGISGFMYGAAVAVLSQCWKHGEELRKWHNIKTQINDEGERANQEGTVLNPALITIKT